MTTNELVTIRTVLPNDLDFIYATWLRGLYYGDTWFKEIPKDIFMKHYHSIIDHILKHPATVIKVACLKDDLDVILGYSIQGQNEASLHWVFVKKAWRKIGIGKSLISSNVNTVTHLTTAGLAILKKHPEVIFNPFAI